MLLRLILVTLVVLVGSTGVSVLTAHAEWKAVGSAHDGNDEWYIDSDTALRHESIVEMSVLNDLKIKKRFMGYYYLSAKARMTFDCETGSSLVLTSRYYPENMARGQVLGTYTNDAWGSGMPESIGQVLWKAACSKSEVSPGRTWPVKREVEQWPYLSVQPRAGIALAFLHSVWHEGAVVHSGQKYVPRTDVMYKSQ